MAFKAKEFKKTKFAYRTETVPLPDLKQWFDGPAEWTVKGLNGNELGRCKEMAERNRKTINAVIETLSKERTEGRDIASQGRDNATRGRDIASQGIVEVVEYMTGLDGSVPMDIALRIELLIAGSIDPICDTGLAVKLNMAFPTEFQILTKKIMRLTGLGYEPGKQKPSGVEVMPESS